MSELICGKTKFSDGGVVRFGHYETADGPVAVWVERDGERQFVATINIPECPLDEGCVWLKGWCENEGVPEALEKAGVVELIDAFAPAGYSVATGARLTPAALSQIRSEG